MQVLLLFYFAVTSAARATVVVDTAIFAGGQWLSVLLCVASCCVLLDYFAELRDVTPIHPCIERYHRIVASCVA